MTGNVPTLSIVFMIVSCAAGLAIPVGLLIYLHKRKHADILPFWVGVATMALFWGVESILANLFVATPAGEALLRNVWLDAAFAGLMAGLFEETGRLVAFRFVLKKQRGKDINALMYGAGHGGIEVLVVLALLLVTDLSMAAAINSGNTAALTEGLAGSALEQAQAQIETLTTTPPWQFLVNAVERAFAMVAHLSMSVLVWFAVKQRKPALYLLAILLHALLDFVAVVLTENGFPALLLELVVMILAAGIALLTKHVWAANAKPEVKIQTESGE